MAFSSKLLRLRSCSLSSPSVLSNTSRSLPGPFLSVHFCSSSDAATAAVDVPDTALSVVTAKHPWPEWDIFLAKLQSKGYFERPAPATATAVSSGEGAADGEAAAAAENAVASADSYPFMDPNRVQNACLKFARERFDLLNFLPKQDIQGIVQYGCPNIFRKPVNSAKRLRQFVQVEERDACGACKLRGSCNKAYRIITPWDEVEPKTVDVVCILVSYAIEPSSLSGENSVDGSVQESARKLLSELTERSDTAIDPSCIKPVSQTSSRSKKSSKSKKSAGKAQGTVGKGSEATDIEMKKGNWLCPKCHFMNFSRNKICFKCEEPRPKRQLNPGEWECPSCCYIQFRRNKVCRKRDHKRPGDDTQDNHQGRRKIRGPGRNRTIDYIDREEDNDDFVSRYKEAIKHGGSMEERGSRRMSDRSGTVGFSDQEEDLLPSNSTIAEERGPRGMPAEVLACLIRRRRADDVGRGR